MEFLWDGPRSKCIHYVYYNKQQSLQLLTHLRMQIIL